MSHSSGVQSKLGPEKNSYGKLVVAPPGTAYVHLDTRCHFGRLDLRIPEALALNGVSVFTETVC